MMMCSVSDLLDYINPSDDGQGTDGAGLKRKAYIQKVCGSCLIIYIMDKKEQIEVYLSMLYVQFPVEGEILPKLGGGKF